MRIVELDWRGPEVADAVRAAAVAAVDETTAEAASSAASRREGRAAAITSEDAAVGGDGQVTGRWGLFPEPRGGDAWYELFIEAGGAFVTGDHAKRRAADQSYPQVASRIAARLGG